MSIRGAVIVLVTLSLVHNLPALGQPAAAASDAVVVFGSATIGTSVLGGRFVLVDTLRADVIARAAQTAHEGELRFSYTVVQRHESTGLIDRIAIGPLAMRPTELSVPRHWRVSVSGASNAVTLIWEPEDLGPPPPGWVDDGVSVYASAYSVAPGDSLTGIAFTAASALDFAATVPIEFGVWQPLRSIEEEWIPDCPFSAAGRVLGPKSAP